MTLCIQYTSKLSYQLVKYAKLYQYELNSFYRANRKIPPQQQQKNQTKVLSLTFVRVSDSLIERMIQKGSLMMSR